jgi:hypothetical protein
MCVRTVAQLIEDHGLKYEELIQVDHVYFAPIGDGRYAAWNCDGAVIELMVHVPGSGLVELNAAPLRDGFERGPVHEVRRLDA